MADMLELNGKGKVITIDVKAKYKPEHPRIVYITGSSLDDEIIEQVKSHIKKDDKVMVVLDSDHHGGHVLEELRKYNNLVSVGCYLVCEDTNLSGNPIMVEHGGGGPM